MTFFFETYGCQMNTAESAALERAALERGWTAAAEGDGADLVLLNTCSVRETAERRVRGRIARYAALKRKRPLVLVVAGCMAERLGDRLREEYPVDFVMGTRSRPLFSGILEAVEQGRAGEYSFPDGPPAGDFPFSPVHLAAGGAFRSLLPIMHGCDNFCSYCIVPHVRGRESSRPPAEIRAEIAVLARAGVREITLLGQNVNSYRSGDVDFPGLLEIAADAARGTSIGWIRFLSANPRDFSDRTIRVIAGDPLFCRHIHLCAQHGSNRVLERMNRGYTREDYLALAEKIRLALPDASLSTDILVGFPGETEEDLGETLDLMERVRFLYAYMYHYNPREGTAAWDFPGRVPDGVKRERLSRVIALQRRHTGELLRGRIGRRERVLVEGISRKNADELLARTARDEMAVVPGSGDLVGRFGETVLASLAGNTFRGSGLVPEGPPGAEDAAAAPA